MLQLHFWNNSLSKHPLHDDPVKASALVQIEQGLRASIWVANEDHPGKVVSGVLVGQCVCPVEGLHWEALQELFKLIHQHDGRLGGDGQSQILGASSCGHAEHLRR